MINQIKVMKIQLFQPGLILSFEQYKDLNASFRFSQISYDDLTNR